MPKTRLLREGMAKHASSQEKKTRGVNFLTLLNYIRRDKLRKKGRRPYPEKKSGGLILVILREGGEEREGRGRCRS